VRGAQNTLANDSHCVIAVRYTGYVRFVSSTSVNRHDCLGSLSEFANATIPMTQNADGNVLFSGRAKGLGDHLAACSDGVEISEHLFKDNMNINQRRRQLKVKKLWDMTARKDKNQDLNTRMSRMEVSMVELKQEAKEREAQIRESRNMWRFLFFVATTILFGTFIGVWLLITRVL